MAQDKKVWDYEEPATNVEAYDGKVVIVEGFNVQTWKDGNIDVTLVTLYLDTGAEVRTGSKQMLKICQVMRRDKKIPFQARVMRVQGDGEAYFTFKPTQFGRRTH